MHFDFPCRCSPPNLPSTRLWALLLLGTAVSLSAQRVATETVVDTSMLKRMSVEELLQQPVVSASRRPEAWGHTASNIFLVRNQSISATGATVLPELLRMAPSLFVAQKSSSEWAINARGFVRTNGASNKLLVLVDGRTVYSPLFSNVFWESTSVFLPDLERVEVISGPAGSTWGANAVNGVINIQSKSARDTVGALATVTSGTEAKGFGVRYGAKLGAAGAMRVYGQSAQHDSTLSAGGDADDFDRWKLWQAGFRADWGTAEAGEFTLLSDTFSGRYDANPADPVKSDGFNILGRWSRELSPDSQLWVRVYHDYSRRDTQSLMLEVSHTTDFEFQHHWKPSAGQDLLWGGNYRMMEDSISDTVGFAILPPDLKFALGSVFAQHELEFADRALKLTTGFRLEHNYFSGWEKQPSVRLAWDRPGRLLWVAASQAARIPSRLDHGFYAPASPPYVVTGGPDFRAEVVRAYEWGWRSHPAKNLSVTLTAYQHDYQDLRSVEPNGAAVIPYTVQNQVEGRSRGLEFFADWDVLPWWRMRFGGFHMQQKTWLKPGAADTEGGNGEGSFPDYQAQLRNTFRLGESLSWWTSLRHVAEVRAYEGGNGAVPAYTELDTSLTWTGRRGLEISLAGRNLLDASHPEIGGLTARREIQRSVQVTARLRF